MINLLEETKKTKSFIDFQIHNYAGSKLNNFNQLIQDAMKDEKFFELKIDESGNVNKLYKLLSNYDTENTMMSLNNKLGILYQVYLRLQGKKAKSVNLETFKEIMHGATIVATKMDIEIRFPNSCFESLIPFRTKYDSQQLISILNLPKNGQKLFLSYRDAFISDLQKLRLMEMNHLFEIDFVANPTVNVLVDICNQYANPKVEQLIIDESKLYKIGTSNGEFEIKNDLCKLIESLQNKQEKLKVNENKFKNNLKTNNIFKLFKNIDTSNSNNESNHNETVSIFMNNLNKKLGLNKNN